MLYDTVSRFVEISRQIGVKGSEPYVRELMATLRRSGFSSAEISELSGDKWSSTLVRQYTIGWVGLMLRKLSTGTSSSLRCFAIQVVFLASISY